ncbi:MAG: MurR/RpiR family transcriptional regulator [Erysipelotrichaceae bacterium]|nr:MurR/RpiR family transcriptional regulator [Erysipelotrichaceae bacterium]
MSQGIRENLSNLNKNELEILQYILDHREAVITMSIQELSKQINYSTSTILRLSRHLGFSGYSELKYYLKNYTTTTPVNPSAPITSFNTIKNDILMEIEGTNGLINTDTMMEICELLDSDLPIYTYAPGGITDVSINHLVSMLFISGRQSIYRLTSPKMVQHAISNLKSQNIFIFISSSGNSVRTLELARAAKLHGQIIISISSILNNDLSELSDYSLRYFTKSNNSQLLDTSSRMGSFYVIHTLITYYNRRKSIAHE